MYTVSLSDAQSEEERLQLISGRLETISTIMAQMRDNMDHLAKAYTVVDVEVKTLQEALSKSKTHSSQRRSQVVSKLLKLLLSVRIP